MYTCICIYMYMCIYTYIYDIIFIPSSIDWWTQVVSVSWILWIYDLSSLSLDDAQFISSTALSLVCVFSWSIVSYSATLWTVAHQAHLSMEFSRQEYWSRLPFPPPGDLPDPGIEPASLASPALVGGCFTTVAPGKPLGKGSAQPNRLCTAQHLNPASAQV